MADFDMCDSVKCINRYKCYRNPASGSIPDTYWQAWIMNPEEVCENFKSETDKEKTNGKND